MGWASTYRHIYTHCKFSQGHRSKLLMKYFSTPNERYNRTYEILNCRRITRKEVTGRFRFDFECTSYNHKAENSGPENSGRQMTMALVSIF